MATGIRVYVSDADLNRAVTDGETLPYQMNCYCTSRFGTAFVRAGSITFDTGLKMWTAFVELNRCA